MEAIRREIRRMMTFDTGREQSDTQSVVTAGSPFGCRSGPANWNDTGMVALRLLLGGNPWGT